MKQRNVLVFPAGSEIGLEIGQALRYCKEVRLFGAGMDISNHARFTYAEYHVLPSIHAPGWVDALASLCARLEIDYIYPAYDDVIVALADHAGEIPATVIAPEPWSCRVTRSKLLTYLALSGKVRVPELFPSPEAVESFPVVVKPERGQGSQGVQVVRTAGQLASALAAVEDPLICEYLAGEEFTVDCFSDRDRGLLFAGARLRGRTRNGISVNTTLAELPEVRPLAEIIGRELRMRGAWFFQIKRSAGGELALLEVAPRIAGSMAAHRVTGVNFPLLSIFEAERLPITVAPIPVPLELDRALGNRYRHQISFSALYLDLDDTLICRNEVNPRVMTLIFQCINRKKPVYLVTRHREDLSATLARHRLSGIFDEVIHLREGEPKSACIREDDAIFVDDSFAERREVAQARGILTFDCSMIEILTDQAEDIP
ncbi:carbamoylphosphate synthase large subunit short form [Geomonas sp. Red276]